MNLRQTSIATLALVASFGFGAAQATTIVNLDATKGTGTFGSETDAALVTLNLAAGSYSLSVIDNTANGGYNGYNYNTGPAIREAFDFSINGGQVYAIDAGSGRFTNFASASDALAAFSSGPYNVYAYNGKASTSPFVTTLSSLGFTLSSASTVTFGIPDDLFSDNRGGVSLAITAAVPEPETYALMLGGLGVLGFVARRRRSA